MRHRNRIHVPGGTYYTVRRCEPPHLIFEQPSEYAAFEEYLALALAANGAKLLGYCWMPNAIHLALRVGRRPVADLMRRLTRYCLRRMHERSGIRINPFPSAFPSLLLDPQAYLPQVIQFLHFLPVMSGTANSPEDSPYTSHAAYHGARQDLPVHTKDLLRHLQSVREVRVEGRLTETLEHCPIRSAFEQLGKWQQLTPPILGDAHFISRLPRKIRERCPGRDAVPTLDQLVAFVTASQGLSREDLLSPRRQHELVLARARVAWLASELGVASLSETARCLQRDVSSLGRAVSRYRRDQPELFRREAFAGLRPLAGTAHATHSRIARGQTPADHTGQPFHGQQRPNTSHQYPTQHNQLRS